MLKECHITNDNLSIQEEKEKRTQPTMEEAVTLTIIPAATEIAQKNRKKLSKERRQEAAAAEKK